MSAPCDEISCLISALTFVTTFSSAVPDAPEKRDLGFGAFFWPPLIFILCGLAIWLSYPSPVGGFTADPTPNRSSSGTSQTAVFGMGCFWCAQALFEKFFGITQVEAGYAGGHTVNPTYKDVGTEQTGHAEVVRITYDPRKITYQQLLAIFWNAHHPAAADHHGDFPESQYRSIILYENPEQKRLAESSARAESSLRPGVETEIAPLTAFYRAEEVHQDYFKKHPLTPHWYLTVDPALQKLEISSDAFICRKGSTRDTPSRRVGSGSQGKFVIRGRKRAWGQGFDLGRR